MSTPTDTRQVNGSHVTGARVPSAQVTGAHRADSTHTPRPDPDVSFSRVSFAGVLRSEWVKLRSLRSSLTALGSSAAILIAIGLVFAAVVAGVLTAGADEATEWAADPAGASLQGTMLAQLIIGVLGVLVMTSEYATGTIRTTLAVVPKRLPVLWAKALVVIAVTFPTMLLSALIAFLGGQAIIGTSDIASASLGDPGVMRAIVGIAGYLTGVAVLGMALGTLLRSTAVAISTLFVFVFLLPGLGELLLPTSVKDDVLQYLPSNAGSAFNSFVPLDGLLSAGVGTAVFAAWVIVPLIAAAVVVKRRSV